MVALPTPTATGTCAVDTFVGGCEWYTGFGFQAWSFKKPSQAMSTVSVDGKTLFVTLLDQNLVGASSPQADLKPALIAFTLLLCMKNKRKPMKTYPQGCPRVQVPRC
jgi:hypothetical protein